MAVEAPACALYVPAAQATQATAEDTPTVPDHLPATHATHGTTAPSTWYSPAGHRTHSNAPASEYVPASHGSHAVACDAAEYFPATHGLHAAVCETHFFPGVHDTQWSLAPLNWWCVPVGQSVQTMDPGVAAYLPLVHAIQRSPVATGERASPLYPELHLQVVSTAVHVQVLCAGACITQRTKLSVRVWRLCNGRGRWPKLTALF